jgi:hypothetical protein
MVPRCEGAPSDRSSDSENVLHPVVPKSGLWSRRRWHRWIGACPFKPSIPLLALVPIWYLPRGEVSCRASVEYVSGCDT